jgi:hypothetical protein
MPVRAGDGQRKKKERVNKVLLPQLTIWNCSIVCSQLSLAIGEIGSDHSQIPSCFPISGVLSRYSCGHIGYSATLDQTTTLKSNAV